jgi:hypothetical protein
VAIQKKELDYRGLLNAARDDGGYEQVDIRNLKHYGILLYISIGI